MHLRVCIFGKGIYHHIDDNDDDDSKVIFMQILESINIHAMLMKLNLCQGTITLQYLGKPHTSVSTHCNQPTPDSVTLNVDVDGQDKDEFNPFTDNLPIVVSSTKDCCVMEFKTSPHHNSPHQQRGTK